MFGSSKDKEIETLRAELEQLKKDVARLYAVMERMAAMIGQGNKN
jgi:hypothetical protein